MDYTKLVQTMRQEATALGAEEISIEVASKVDTVKIVISKKPKVDLTKTLEAINNTPVMAMYADTLMSGSEP